MFKLRKSPKLQKQKNIIYFSFLKDIFRKKFQKRVNFEITCVTLKEIFKLARIIKSCRISNRIPALHSKKIKTYAKLSPIIKDNKPLF